jgi:AraC-like DNA-binding protein
MKELIQALAFSAPAACALCCLAMVLIDIYSEKKKGKDRQLRLFLSLTLVVAALCWAGLVFEVAYHRLFAGYFTVFLLTLMLDQILIYRFVHILTATDGKNRFSRLHFAVPALLLAVSIATDLTVPMHEKEAVIYGNDDASRWFATLYSLTGVIFVVYNSLYPTLVLLRIRRYRRHIVDYSADRQRTSLNWLVVMQILTLITIPVPLAGLLLDPDVFSNFYFSIQGVAPTFFVYPIFCYNLLSDNYVIIAPDSDTLPENVETGIDAKHFVRYMHDKKPYLNPQLRITDVAYGLCTNRNYVSAHINRTYGMNFSRFINNCRLKELDRLRLAPQHKDTSTQELLTMAGFGSYHSYLRTKKEEDKANMLKEY